MSIVLESCGQLAAGWQYRRFDSLVSHRNGFGDLSLPLLGVSVARGVIPRDSEEGRAASEDLSGYRVVHRGDLVVNRLVARDGAFGRAPVDGLVSPAYWVLRPRPYVDVRFLDHLLHSVPVLAELRRISKDMPPAQYDLPWPQAKAMRLPVPPLIEQRRIADFLDRETARIKELRASLDTLLTTSQQHTLAIRHEELRGAELDQALTGGSWPEGWPKLKGVVTSWHSGGTPTSDEPAYWSDDASDPEWVAIGDMSGRRVVGVGSRRLSAEGIKAARLKPVPPRSLLVAMYASVGEVAEVDRELFCNQALLGLHLPQEGLRHFLHEWLLLVRPHLRWFSKDNTQANLTGDLVRNIPFPPLTSGERQAAVARIEAASSDGAVRRSEIAALSLDPPRELAEAGLWWWFDPWCGRAAGFDANRSCS